MWKLRAQRECDLTTRQIDFNRFQLKHEYFRSAWTDYTHRVQHLVSSFPLRIILTNIQEVSCIEEVKLHSHPTKGEKISELVSLSNLFTFPRTHNSECLFAPFDQFGHQGASDHIHMGSRAPSPTFCPSNHPEIRSHRVMRRSRGLEITGRNGVVL